MNLKQRAQFVQKTLDRLFPMPLIPLSHVDPFTLLVAVVLSAQNTDAKVNLITPILFAAADTPKKMLLLGVEEIKRIIKPCGLSVVKSKALWNLSKILLEKFDGKVPDNFADLESLPGVGHKTASVVMAQAFGKPAFPVDTHIHRCAERWKLSSGKNVVQTEKDLKILYKEECWNKIHLQIIYFARQYCQARRHFISECPICGPLSSVI
jgi:endonuclease-3